MIAWAITNGLAYGLFFNQAYMISWGVFGLLGFSLILLLVSTIALGITLLVFKLVQANPQRILYFTKNSLAYLGVCLILLLGQVYLSQIYVYHPGDMETSEWIEVDLNDSKQYISVRTEDESHPVILFFAGGPGGSQIQATREFFIDLSSSYTIVNWEQPGSGKSFKARDNEDIRPETYIEDAHALTQYLKEEYQQDKIYLMGESWGSYIAVNLAKQYPEDYYAIVTTGQMVDFAETEQYCYDMALIIARQNEDTQQIDALLKLGQVPLRGDNIAIDSATYLMYLHQEMGRNEEINETSWGTLDTLLSPEYSIIDSLNFVRALYYTFSQVYQQLYEEDLRLTHTKLEVPIYILHGRHDVNAPTYLVDEYYQLIEAPDKALVYFEASGHNPWITEPDLFQEKVMEYFQFHE